MQRSYGGPVISQRVPGGVAHKIPAVPAVPISLRCPLAPARLRHYGGGQLAVAYLYGELRDLGYLKRCFARGLDLGRIPIAEVPE